MRVLSLVVLAIMFTSPSLVADGAAPVSLPPDLLFSPNPGQGCSGEALLEPDSVVRVSTPLEDGWLEARGEVPEWIAMDAGSCDALCTLTADACYASCPGSGLPGRIQCMRDCLGAYDACMETCLGH